MADDGEVLLAEAEPVADLDIPHAADEAAADNHLRAAALEHPSLNDAYVVAHGSGFGTDAAYRHVGLCTVQTRFRDDDVHVGRSDRAAVRQARDFGVAADDRSLIAADAARDLAVGALAQHEQVIGAA